jgi:hypothetical protein
MAVMRTECLTEEVSEGDMVTGSFVVLDHQSAWAEQHPGMDLGVSSSRLLAELLQLPYFATILYAVGQKSKCTSLGHGTCWKARSVPHLNW